MNVTVEKFSPEEQAQTRSFILRLWKEFKFIYIKKLDYDLDDIQSFYVETGGIFYVLKDGNKVIGTIAVINKGNHIAELKRLYIDKPYRGNGYGSKLVDEAIEFCNDNEFIKIEFETDKIFKKAHLLYKKRGFKIIKENQESFYMEKYL